MCGIAGYLSKSMIASRDLGLHMAGQIAYRGPDASDCWVDEAAGVTLAHRRLSILDLSEAGRQPMVSSDGRYVLVYNGEVYNHRAIRDELLRDGWNERFAGHSDTETILALIQMRGVERALPMLNGMFALALWDKDTRRLTLARDRIGEKPLYYGWAGETFLFGSELKALTCHPEWRGELDRAAIGRYFRLGYVPDPLSIYQGIAKLPPASFTHIDCATDKGRETPIAYWTLPLPEGAQPCAHSSDAEAISAVHSQLLESVGSRMEADVPLGAFLSGGIDSSTIAALMQAKSATPVRTFTIGFENSGYDEAPYARRVARHLGTNHTEVYLNHDDALTLVPRLGEIWDEPFADSSQLPSLLLAKITAQHVKVALSGDGGDELFGGYNRYGKGYDHFRSLQKLPLVMRRSARPILSALARLPDNGLARSWLFNTAPPALATKLQKLARVADAADPEDFYDRLVTMRDAAALVIGQHRSPLPPMERWPHLADPRQSMAYLDIKTYLPGDILTKVDRATMSESLEARAPFLDPNLMANVWQLPYHFKIRDGKTKWILRQVLHQYVPKEMFERPKMGFAIPLGAWLRGPLRSWAEDLINRDRLRREGYLVPEQVYGIWARFIRGHEWLQEQVWAILMFQLWLETPKNNYSTIGNKIVEYGTLDTRTV